MAKTEEAVHRTAAEQVREAFLALPSEHQIALFEEIGREILSRREAAFLSALRRLNEAAEPQFQTALGENHPLASVLGRWKDDPRLDVLMENIAEYRRRREAEDD